MFATVCIGDQDYKKAVVTAMAPRQILIGHGSMASPLYTDKILISTSLPSGAQVAAYSTVV